MPDGFHHLPGYWDSSMQHRAVAWLREHVTQAPLQRPKTPGARPMHVRITSAGPAGWWSDGGGYRYIKEQPNTGRPWPPAPPWILEQACAVMTDVGDPFKGFDGVLTNYYAPDAFLSTHRDESEPDLEAPIVSFSLGAPARFVLRGPERDDPIARSVVLGSGDAMVLSGACRLWYHEVARILPNEPMFAPPVKGDGRLSILVRKVTP